MVGFCSGIGLMLAVKTVNNLECCILEARGAKLEARGVNQYYGIGAVLAPGVIGGLGYYIYRTKKVEQPQRNNPEPHPQVQPQTNKFEMD